MSFYPELNVHRKQMNRFTKTTSRISIFQECCFPSFFLGIPVSLKAILVQQVGDIGKWSYWNVRARVWCSGGKAPSTLNIGTAGLEINVLLLNNKEAHCVFTSEMYPGAVSTIEIRIYKTVILPSVLYGCETWSVTLREEHRLRVFENRVLRRIFGPKRDEVKGEWRKLHKKELRDLYSSLSIIRMIKSRRMRWAGHVARMGEKWNGYRLLVGKPEGKRPLGRPRRRWVDNIRMDLGEVRWGDVDWIGLSQDRNTWRALVNSVLNLRVP
jgi:hypothetical protein